MSEIENIETLTDESSASADDEKRLRKLGYNQETKRIFSTFTNFGLSASMVSIMLGIIPLYGYSLQNGGPVVMVWSWIVVGIFALGVVSSLGEIACAFPTMGALYFWAYRLGGPKWGPFASWTAGWCNLLGQIAGFASGGYSGAQIIASIIYLINGDTLSNAYILLIYAIVLTVAGVVNTYSETLLTSLCYISVMWHICGALIIIIWMAVTAPIIQPASFVFTEFINESETFSSTYVALLGVLAAGSTFTGYDTAAHVAEETRVAHKAAPWGMLLCVINCLVLGVAFIIGLNFCIQDVDSLISKSGTDDGSGNALPAYTLLWQQTVGNNATIFFLGIVFIAVECSNCANLTSACRMVYAFSRDKALPASSYFYHLDPKTKTPVRAIWFCVVVAFILGIPGLTNETVLSALFSLTATGLYSSYLIPILLRITVSRNTFEAKEFSLGKYSVPVACISLVWCVFMVIVLCLPSVTPITLDNMNYSPVGLGAVLVCCWLYWTVSARHWFKGAEVNLVLAAGTGDLESRLVTIVPTDHSEGFVQPASSKTSLESVVVAEEMGGGGDSIGMQTLELDLESLPQQFCIETHDAVL